MAGRRKGSERREPNFDVTPEPDARADRPEPKVEAAEDGADVSVDDDDAPITCCDVTVPDG